MRIIQYEYSESQVRRFPAGASTIRPALREALEFIEALDNEPFNEEEEFYDR